jgi:hypothetical protein
MPARLILEASDAARLSDHLARGDDEQLAFMLAEWDGDQAHVVELRLVENAAFDLQTPWHISLGDDEVGEVIRWAHEAGLSLVEAHVHREGDPAAFSPSDRGGLHAFVPHVWWRLRHRPYIALVFGETTYDALVWLHDATTPEGLDALVVPGAADRMPTGRSLRTWRRP